jgi:hypothetical protein
MGKKPSGKLTPTTSQAKYPTLIDLCRESGLIFNGVAAAVLATGLAGCGKNDDKAVRTAGVVDASYFQAEVRLPGDVAGPETGIPDRAPISDGLPPMPSYLDADVAQDAADARTPDTATPDQRVIIIDGLPVQPYDLGYFDGGAKDAADAGNEDQRPGSRDGRVDSESIDNAPGIDGLIDSELDVK